MGKQHFPKFLPDDLLPVIHRHLHIFQRQSLELFYVLFRAGEGHQGRGKLRHRMARCFCKPVAVPGGTGGRVGQASCGHDHSPGFDHFPAFFQGHAQTPAILADHLFHSLIIADGHSQPLHPPFQGRDHIR